MSTATLVTENPQQAAASPSPFPPIADYAFLSDCHTGALVAPDGAIDWLCVPSFDAPSVFASLLDRQAAYFRFAPFGIAEELSENEFVVRYRTDETDDGLSGEEGTFLICSFWLVSALAYVGELRRACDLMERLLRIASPLGLYAEEFDTASARHLGNFPQAFSHLALIEAAARIIVHERVQEAR